MTDQTSANPDHADLIARLQARKGFGHFPGDSTWFQLDQPDKDCADAAQALIQAGERIAEQRATITESVKQIIQLAREAGEAKGRPEMSELAGIVEGWRARAQTAEARVAEQFEAKAVAGVRVKALEDALKPFAAIWRQRTKPIKDGMKRYTNLNASAWGYSDAVLSWGDFERAAALSQSGEG
jgi:hypothetical protein